MKNILVGLLLSGVTVGSSWAQTGGTMPSEAPPQVPLKPVFGYSPVGSAALDRVRLNALALQNWPSSIAARERRDRMARAERLAVLVNLGRCHDAHGVALAEGDAAMADRVASVCRGEP